MDLVHLHLLLNHWPIIGTFIGVGLFLVALVADSDDLKQACLALFAGVALLAIPAYLSGDAANLAYQQVEGAPKLSSDLVETHKGAALVAFFSLGITGIFSMIGLWNFNRITKDPALRRPARWNLSAVMFFSILTAYLMAITGNTGGNIRHEELLKGPGATGASAVGALGAMMTKWLEWLVVESSRWAWPLAEDLHFLGLILLVMAVGVVNLRTLGFMKKLPMAPLYKFLPWGIAGFVINVATGLLFFIGMPYFYVLNFVFQLKVVFVFLAAANLLVFYCSGTFRDWARVESGESAPVFAKLIALSSLLLWFAVVIIGRYIPIGEV